MIQAIQRFSQSKPAKIFLAIVALSFIAFFGGGNWFRPKDPNAVIATVGDYTIGRGEYYQMVQRQMHQLMAQMGDSFSQEQALQLGVPQMVLQHQIQEVILNLESENLGLAASDDVVRETVQSMEVFHNDKGQFDHNRFIQIIRNQGMTEDGFIAEIRQDIIREQLTKAIMAGAVVPEEMVDYLFEAQYQNRQAAQVIISAKDMPVPPPPADATLEAFYNKHKKNFKTPELRSIVALVINPEILAKDMSFTDEEVKSTYEAKADVFGDKPLQEVIGTVIADVKKQKANEKAYELTRELDDKIAGGSTLEELAQETPSAKLVKLDGVDIRGKDRTGKISSSLPQDEDLANELLSTAYGLEEGADSPFSQVKDGEYYTLRVDKIQPTAFQPFSEIKDRVLKVWTDLEQLKAAHAKAKKYVKDFNQGDRKVAMMTLLPSLSLSEPSPSVPDEVKELVFSLRPSKAGMTEVKGGFAIVVLNNIVPVDAKIKEEKMAEFKEVLLNHYRKDIMLAYLNALKIRYPVRINSAAIKALFSPA